MAAKNVELRQNIGGAFNHADSLAYIRSHWDLIVGKPSTYTPATHPHAIDDITDLKEKLLFYVEGNSGGTAGAWTGTIPSITSLFTGLTIAYKINTAGASTTNLNINGYGNKVVRRNTGNLTTHLPVGTVVILTYDGTYWVWADYDSDSNYNLRSEAYMRAGLDPIYSYKIVIEGEDGRLYPLTLENGTGTSKTISTRKFKIKGKIYYYGSTTTIAADGLSRYYFYASVLLDSRYTFNQSGGYLQGYPVYLKATDNGDGTFTLHNASATAFYTQSLPTTEDGFIYIRLGFMHDTSYNLRLNVDHPIYEYKNGYIREYIPEHKHGNEDLPLSSTPINATELSSSVDLNALFQAGFYYQTANADTTGNNYPVNAAGSLLVQKSAGQVTQMYIVYSNGDIYTRSYYTSWSSWNKVYHSNNKPTFADIQSKPTTLAGYGITDARTASQITSEIATAIANLINSSPGALDTLDELAQALGDDPNFATTINTALSNRVIKNSDITPGTKTKITFDAKGLVTGGADLVASDIPNLDWAKITSGKPTTLGGYGITDAPKLTVSNSRIEFANSNRYFAITYDAVEGKTKIYVRHETDTEKQIYHSGSPQIDIPIMNASNYVATDKLYTNQIRSDGGNVAFYGLDYIDFDDIPLINVPFPSAGHHAVNKSYVDGKVVSEYTLVSSSFTLALTDQGKFYCMNSTSARTITIPPNSSVAFPINTEIHIARYNTGTVQILNGSGVTILSEGSKRYINAQYQAVTLKKIATDTWILFGALAS